MALVLDAVAIAAQSLVGAALGAAGGTRPRARALARPGHPLRAGARAWRSARCSRRWPGCCRRCSPPTPRCWPRCRSPWWFFVGAAAGGRGGVRHRRGAARCRATPRSCAPRRCSRPLVGFLPLIWASLGFGWGLAGIWTGLAVFMLVRLVAVGCARPLRRLGGDGGGPHLTSDGAPGPRSALRARWRRTRTTAENAHDCGERVRRRRTRTSAEDARDRTRASTGSARVLRITGHGWGRAGPCCRARVPRRPTRAGDRAADSARGMGSRVRHGGRGSTIDRADGLTRGTRRRPPSACSRNTAENPRSTGDAHDARGERVRPRERARPRRTRTSR